MTDAGGGGCAARAALIARLRRYEWAVARGEHAREVSAAVRECTHDLLNLFQIVDLASQQLVARCGAPAAELADDLRRATIEARTTADALALLARPAAPPPHAPARTLVAAALRGVMSRGSVTAAAGIAVAWSADELAILVIALELDAPRGELVVRSRRVEDGEIVEVVCGPIEEGAVAVRVAQALAKEAGGEVTVEPRGGGVEVVVTIATV